MMDPRLPFTPPRNHGEEIANAFAQRDFDRAVMDAHSRELEEAKDRLFPILIVVGSACATFGGIAWAVTKYLAINHPL